MQKKFKLCIIIYIVITIFSFTTVFADKESSSQGTTEITEEKKSKVFDEITTLLLTAGDALSSILNQIQLNKEELDVMYETDAEISEDIDFSSSESEGKEGQVNININSEIEDDDGTKVAYSLDEFKIPYFPFSIEAMLRGIGIFDVNFLTSENGSNDITGIWLFIRDIVAQLLRGIITLSLAALLLYLVYSAIGIIWGTLATDTSKRAMERRRNFKIFAISFLKLLGIVFIMAITINMIKAIMNAIGGQNMYNIRVSIDGIGSFNTNFIGLIRTYAQSQVIIQRLAYIVLYYIILGLTLWIALTFIKRFFHMAFLTIIAPVVVIMEAVQQVKDDKPKNKDGLFTYTGWIKAYLTIASIQLIYFLAYYLLVDQLISKIFIVFPVIALYYIGRLDKSIGNLTKTTLGFNSTNLFGDMAKEKAKENVKKQVGKKVSQVSKVATSAYNFAEETGLKDAAIDVGTKKLGTAAGAAVGGPVGAAVGAKVGDVLNSEVKKIDQEVLKPGLQQLDKTSEEMTGKPIDQTQNAKTKILTGTLDKGTEMAKSLNMKQTVNTVVQATGKTGNNGNKGNTANNTNNVNNVNNANNTNNVNNVNTANNTNNVNSANNTNKTGTNVNSVNNTQNNKPNEKTKDSSMQNLTEDNKETIDWYTKYMEYMAVKGKNNEQRNLGKRFLIEDLNNDMLKIQDDSLSDVAREDVSKEYNDNNAEDGRTFDELPETFQKAMINRRKQEIKQEEAREMYDNMEEEEKKKYQNEDGSIKDEELLDEMEKRRRDLNWKLATDMVEKAWGNTQGNQQQNQTNENNKNQGNVTDINEAKKDKTNNGSNIA